MVMRDQLNQGVEKVFAAIFFYFFFISNSSLITSGLR